MDEELKPCPFCGETPFVNSITDDNGYKHFWVVCCNRKCSVMPATNLADGSQDRIVIEAWNHRTIPEGYVKKSEVILDIKKIEKILEEKFMLVEGVTRDWIERQEPDEIYFEDVAKAIASHAGEIVKEGE